MGPAWNNARTINKKRKRPDPPKGLLNEDGDIAVDVSSWWWTTGAPSGSGPSEKSGTPERSSWWLEIGAILEGNVVEVEIQSSLDLDQPESTPLPPEEMETTKVGEGNPFAPVQTSIPGLEPSQLNLGIPPEVQNTPDLHDRHGELRITKLRKSFPRVKLVESIARKTLFHHWELTFPDIFADQGGFDLVIGNPPWIQIQWNEGGILANVISYHSRFKPMVSQRRIQAFWETKDSRKIGLMN